MFGHDFNLTGTREALRLDGGPQQGDVNDPIAE
jgi:hypothetical protein